MLTTGADAEVPAQVLENICARDTMKSLPALYSHAMHCSFLHACMQGDRFRRTYTWSRFLATGQRSGHHL